MSNNLLRGDSFNSSVVNFPDIETASDGYAKRFSGEVGKYFLTVQERNIFLGLKNKNIKKVLEVGGGHCQLTEKLLESGYEVWLQGGKKEALFRAEQLLNKYPGRLHIVESNYTSLPFAEREFDVAIAIRLFAHFEQWREIVAEMSRVSNSIIFDFAPSGSFNILYPILFSLKKRVEGNTRTYLRFSVKEVLGVLTQSGFNSIKINRQFFMPMVLHRWLKNGYISEKVENFCSSIGITKRFGSPAIAIASK